MLRRKKRKKKQQTQQAQAERQQAGGTVVRGTGQAARVAPTPKLLSPPSLPSPPCVIRMKTKK